MNRSVYHPRADCLGGCGKAALRLPTYERVPVGAGFLTATPSDGEQRDRAADHGVLRLRTRSEIQCWVDGSGERRIHPQGLGRCAAGKASFLGRSGGGPVPHRVSMFCASSAVRPTDLRQFQLPLLRRQALRGAGISAAAGSVTPACSESNGAVGRPLLRCLRRPSLLLNENQVFLSGHAVIVGVAGVKTRLMGLRSQGEPDLLHGP
jgi:hypothetical protein